MIEKGRKLRLAVFVSGSGTNLQSLIDKTRDGTLAAEIVAVLSDRSDAHGLIRAEKAGIPHFVIDYRRYLKMARPMDILPISLDELVALYQRQRILPREESDNSLRRLAALVCAEREAINILETHQPDYICLAGFMRLISPYFLDHYNKGLDYRVINIHPALLPAFPGQHGYEDTYRYGCRWGGITVHFVDEGEDSGPIIAQAVYPIWPTDDLDDVKRRGLCLEYQVYAQCLNWLANGYVELNEESESSMKVRITDPDYSRIVRDWITSVLPVC